MLFIENLAEQIFFFSPTKGKQKKKEEENSTWVNQGEIFDDVNCMDTNRLHNIQILTQKYNI